MSSVEKSPSPALKSGTPETPSTSKLSLALKLSSALLRHDARMLPLLFFLASLPQLLDFFGYNTKHTAKVLLICLDICIDLIVLAWVAGRWIPRMLWGKQDHASKHYINFVYPGALYGLLGFIPLGILPVIFGDMHGGESGVLWAIAFLLGAACYYFLFRLYFFFLPAFGGIREAKTIFAFASDMTREKPLLPLAVFLPPIGVIALGAALTETFFFSFPSSWKSLCFAAWSVLAGILITYLSIAVAITHIPMLRLSQLQPSEDWEQRLQSLAAWSVSWLTFILAPKRSALLFLAAVLLWSGTLVKTMTTHPGFQLNIESIEVVDRQLSIRILLKDEKNALQNVHPAFFRLAGHEGEQFSKKLTKVLLNGEEISPYLVLPSSREEQLLILDFEVPRDGDDLRHLKDLFLWYQGNALERLDFEKLFEK